MGSEISSCCGGAGDRNTQVEFPALSPRESGSTTAPGDDASLSPAELGAREQLYEGFEVHLILQDKSRLDCQIRMDRTHEFMLLLCNKKARVIHMKDIQSILHTPEELQRVESSAGITDTETCAAIHLAASGNCIPLFFKNIKEKAIFLDIVEEARLAHKPC